MGFIALTFFSVIFGSSALATGIGSIAVSVADGTPIDFISLIVCVAICIPCGICIGCFLDAISG